MRPKAIHLILQLVNKKKKPSKRPTPECPWQTPVMLRARILSCR